MKKKKQKVKRKKMEINKKSEKILYDFINTDGKYAWKGKPWGHLVKEFIIDDVSYYLIKKEEGAYESIYIIIMILLLYINMALVLLLTYHL